MMKLFGSLAIAAGIALVSCSGTKQLQVKNPQPVLDQKTAQTVMHKWPFPFEDNGTRRLKWTYETGVFLEGIANVWKSTADKQYFTYIQNSMDAFVDEDGTIKTYKYQDFNLDNIRTGRSLLLLYRVTGKEKYYKAALNLRKQLKEQPRTSEGSFWHKKIYPYQVWLDGLYMAMPFYAEWAAVFNEPGAYNDIAIQFTDIEKHARDSKTGLIYHGWDESKQQQWANKETGNSPNFWGRAMGWYGMALVDVLDYFPKEQTHRPELIAVLNRYAEAIAKFQDKKTGLWWQVLDKADSTGNYLEASGSCMFVYTLAKASRLGYIDSKYAAVALKGYEGISKKFLETDAEGYLHLNGTVSVAGLGGKPYRDGSYAYYLSEKVVQDDPKGMGAFILAANEMQLRNISQVGAGKTVTLDNYFNNEFNKNIQGESQSFHYVWDEMDNNGFSLLQHIIQSFGAKTTTLKKAPTAVNLAETSVYIIVDPDTEKETPDPHFMDSQSILNLKDWVAKGGVLLLLANDYTNCELDHFNQLTKAFGAEYKKELKNPVKGNQFEMGAIQVEKGHDIFTSGPKLYLKEISTLSVEEPAEAVLSHKGDVVMAKAKVGKGTVFMVGDPWLYNEYVDGRKLPSDFQNFTAANELVYWLLKQSEK